MDQIMLRLCLQMSESSLTGDCMQITSPAMAHAELPHTEDSSGSYKLSPATRKTPCSATLHLRHLHKPGGNTGCGQDRW